MVSSIIRLLISCNEKCLFCTVGKDLEHSLSTIEVKNLIEKVSDFHNQIAFTGGEPTIREDLIELVEYSKLKNFSIIEIQSNGLNLSKISYVEKLINAGANVFLIALHSHKKEISEELVGKTNSYEKTIKCLKNLQKFEVDVHISHVITSLNYKDLVDFVKYCKNLAINKFYFSFVRPNGLCENNPNLVPTLLQIEKHINRLIKFCSENKIIISFEGIPLCYLIGNEKLSSEIQRINSKAVHLEKDIQRQATHTMHLQSSKIKGLQCKLCKLNSFCPGVWKEYAKLHGTFELFPQYEETNISSLKEEIR